MNKEPTLRVGHPAYSGANRQTTKLNPRQAFNELVNRGVTYENAKKGIDNALAGSHAVVWTKTKSVIEVVKEL